LGKGVLGKGVLGKEVLERALEGRAPFREYKHSKSRGVKIAEIVGIWGLWRLWDCGDCGIVGLWDCGDCGITGIANSQHYVNPRNYKNCRLTALCESQKLQELQTHSIM
jgi:hypothetical protein